MTFRKLEITAIPSSIESNIITKNKMDTPINDGDNGFNREQEAFGGKSSKQLLLEQEAVLSSEEVV
eukprot:2409984-Ditylum_brightwellii.AAC.1